MAMLYDSGRHERLANPEWDPGPVTDAIAAICRDMESAFTADHLWPLHPEDDEPGNPADGILRGLYDGAGGLLHALDRLAEGGFHEPSFDIAAIARRLHGAALNSPDHESAGASLFSGSSGILLVAHRLSPSATTADTMAEVIAANARHPSNELMLGSPGTMLAARAMHSLTGEERFAELWRTSARELLDRQEEDGLWSQDLYVLRACATVLMETRVGEEAGLQVL